jgi:LPS sulfotransferase NodH
VGRDPERRPRGPPALIRLRKLNRVLDRVETALGDGGDAPLHHAPLFIVGAPRTGSTLLYQLVVEAFDVGYLSNRHCRLWGMPSLVERFRRPLPPGAYESRFGRTSGPASPSECEQFWYRFFRRSPQYLPLEEADPAHLRRLRAAVRSLGNAAGRPLVFKNLLNTLRLRPLATALPEAVFVEIRRDLVATATSLLAGRKQLFGDYGHWWSSEPPEIARLRALPPEQQVVEQIRAVEALAARDRQAIGGARFLELRYDDVCDDPARALASIAELAERNGFQLARRRDVPAKFPRSEPAKIDRDLHDRLLGYVTGA